MTVSVRSRAIAAQGAEIDASTKRAVAAREGEQKARRMTALESMAMRCRVSEKELTAALTSTVFKECKSQAQFLALVVVANEYGLNPLTKEIYAFPSKGGGVVPMVSVDGWISLMNRHPDHDGIEFEYVEDANGNLIAVESIIHHKGRSKPIKTMEFMSECKGNTGPWQKSPRRMLRHRALIQGARIAFGFSGIYAEVDAEDDIIAGEYTVAGDSPAILPGNDQFENSSSDEPDQGEDEHDPETGEIARDPRTGMTEISEEEARALDAGQGDEDRIDAVNYVEGLEREFKAAKTDAERQQIHEHNAKAISQLQQVYPDLHERAMAAIPDYVEDADEQPAWAVPVAMIRQMIAKATNKAGWTRADNEFQKIMAGLPDDIAGELNAELTAKRKALSNGDA